VKAFYIINPPVLASNSL